MKRALRHLLYRSWDSSLAPADESRLAQGLQDFSELRAEREQLGWIRNLVAQSAAAAFRPLFAERVLARLSRPLTVLSEKEQFLRSIQAFFRPLGLAATLAVLALLLYAFSASGHLSMEVALGLPEVTVENIVLAVQ